MLGARTKLVNSYGKRNRRIVDVSDNGISGRTEILSIFDDLPPAPKLGGIASKMRKRENLLPSKPKPPSPKVVGMQKKRLSPALSPLRKKRADRIAQLKQEGGGRVAPMPAAKSKPATSRTGSEQDPVVLSATPPRAPLSAVPLNVPGSPAVASKLHRNLGVGPKPSTPRLNKPFTPFVDVDIIVLDDDGRTVRTERRVSRTGVEVNPINRVPSRSKGKRKLDQNPVEILTSDSELETISQPKRPKRLAGRRAAIVISDESDSEEESTIPSSTQNPSTGCIRHLNPSPSLPSFGSPNATTSRLQVEVVVPRAPYLIHSKPLTPTRSASLMDVKIPSTSDYTSNSDAEIVAAPYRRAPSPIAKPRRLTPIRGRHRKGLYGPPSPPSPSTPTDFDISLELEQLSIGSEPDDYTQTKPRIPEDLVPLLEECGQEVCGPHEFSAFIETFPFDPVIQRGTKHPDMKFRKIGEASYSEVFGIGDVVLKVIPLRDESGESASTNTHTLRMNARESQEEEEIDGPAPSDAKDVRKEIIVTRAMGEVYGGFVKLLKTYIVRGRYPEVLLKLWDGYNERKGSESVRPDTFSVSQVYAIIVLPNGGPDLEAYSFFNASKTGWRQACSLFWQVAKALGHAERLVSFEHRDLHWGQILVKDLPTKVPPLKALSTNQKLKPKTTRLFMDDPIHGVRATVIDLGLSRMDAGDGADGDRVQWTPFDEEVFMGEGDYQFDVYRMMRDHTSGAWEEFHPITNVMWLHYLVLKLLNSKGIKPPAVSRKIKPAAEPRIPTAGAAFSEKDCYECLVDIEDWLSKCIAEIAPIKVTAKGKARRKAQAPVKRRSPVSGPACAGEIVEYGAKKGWIKSA